MAECSQLATERSVGDAAEYDIFYVVCSVGYNVDGCFWRFCRPTIMPAKFVGVIREFHRWQLHAVRRQTSAQCGWFWTP